tara:strand:+ start:12611 stop:13255 length:645 start_codon:yes stop_codon:yes gene_type:complete
MSISYFNLLPNFKYLSPLKEGGKRDQYIEVKNLFKRIRLKSEVFQFALSFNDYIIDDGERPDTIAEGLYASAKYDWVVLLSANIINVEDQWPVPEGKLWDLADEKYGGDLNAVHHYETTEVKNSDGKLILPGKLVVDPDFTIQDPNNYTQTINPTVAVSNWLVETRKNNEKRAIRVVKREYLNTLVNDTKNILQYQNSSQYKRNTGKVATNNLV